MVMTKFFQFKKEVLARERTPFRAIANQKIAEIRLSKASSSGSGSPGRVHSARPLRAVVDVEVTSPSPSQSVLTTNPPQTESTHFPGQHTPSSTSHADTVPPSSQLDEPNLTAFPTESTHSHVVHTTSHSTAPTESVHVRTPRKKRLVPCSALSLAKRARVTIGGSCSAPAQSSGLETATDAARPDAPSKSKSDKHPKLWDSQEEDLKHNVNRLSQAQKYFSRLYLNSLKGKYSKIS